MLGFRSMAKMAKGGGVGPDELAAMLEMIGMKVDFQTPARPGYREAFADLGRAAVDPSSILFVINGEMAGGEGMRAIIVLGPHHTALCPTSQHAIATEV